MKTITDHQQFPIHAPFLDASNQEGAIYRPGSAQWVAPACVTIVIDPAFPGDDSRRIVKGSIPGVGQIFARADAGTNSTQDIKSSPAFDVTVTAGQLASIGALVDGSVTEQP